MLSVDESRNNKNIRHFTSRAKQPKVVAEGYVAKVASVHGIAPVNVVFDQDFGSVSDQIDDTRFKYIGTSPQNSQYMCNRRMGQYCMKNSS